MVEQAVALTRVASSMQESIRSFASLLEELSGDRLKALTLFGAVLEETFHPDRRPVRSVLVLDRVDLALLRRIAERGLKLGKSGIAAPLVMTPDYIKASCDTFPLELMEIQQQHLTIAGEEFFDGLEFKSSDVRLQCERELKTVLIGMRQGLLAAAGREKLIEALQRDVADGLMRTLRGLRWLKGQRDALPRSEDIGAVEKAADLKLPGLRTGLDPNATHGADAFDALYRDVEALGEVVDGW